MICRVDGWTVSPRKSRRKSACFSSTTVRMPARASNSPTIIPAGPPPATQHVIRRGSFGMINPPLRHGWQKIPGMKTHRVRIPFSLGSFRHTEEPTMSVLTTTSSWARRSLMAAAIVATGALTLGATTNQASAQVYAYPYTGYYPYYPAYSYYAPYYPYYGYPGYVHVGWGWGWGRWHGGWGWGHGGWGHGGWHHHH